MADNPTNVPEGSYKVTKADGSTVYRKNIKGGGFYDVSAETGQVTQSVSGRQKTARGETFRTTKTYQEPNLVPKQRTEELPASIKEKVIKPIVPSKQTELYKELYPKTQPYIFSPEIQVQKGSGFVKTQYITTPSQDVQMIKRSEEYRQIGEPEKRPTKFQQVKEKVPKLIERSRQIEAFKPSKTGKELASINISKPYRETEEATSRLLKEQLVSPIEKLKESKAFKPSKEGKELISVKTGFVGKIPIAIKEEAIERPIKFAAETYAISKGFEIAEGIVSTGKTLKVISKGKYVPAEKVIAKEVLSGQKAMPLSKSVSESLKSFKQSKDVVTASPSKIRSTKAGLGKKGAKGLEDPGIYVTPKGKASPYFLRIGKETYEGYTLNPLGYVKRLFQTPTFTQFRTKGVSLQPRSVVSKKGFSETRKFFEQYGSKTGKVYITKRSEIGLGAIKRQGELGTSELEAVIPYKSKFKYIPSNEYTIYKGRAIPIRKAEVISEVKDILPKSKIGKARGKFGDELSRISSSVSEPRGKFVYVSGYSKPYKELSKGYPSKVSSGVSFKSPVSRLKYESPSKAVSSISNISRVSKASSKKYSITSTPSVVTSSKSFVRSPKVSSIAKPIPIKTFETKPKIKLFKGISKVSAPKFEYIPTVEATYFKVKGRKTSDVLARSGLVLRPIVR